MTEYDLIFGANGQDGKILSELLSETNKSVVLVSRGLDYSLPTNQLSEIIDLNDIKKLDHILHSKKFRNVFYLAAAHTTQKNFDKINDDIARQINFIAPKYILENLTKNKNVKNFIYASSKLVFYPENEIYKYNSTRRENNSYSKWKNEFEKYIEHKKMGLNLLLIVWFSNHDSIYRSSKFLLPRLSKKIAINIIRGKKIFDEEFDLYNDWGDAHEFIKVINDFVNNYDHSGVHKQFLSNNDVIYLDDVIKEILSHGRQYKEYLDTLPVSQREPFYISKNELISRPKITSRQTIWKLVEYQLKMLENEAI